MPLEYHREWLELAKPWLERAQANKPPMHDVEARRAKFEGLFAKEAGSIKLPEDVEQTIHHVQAEDGHQIPVYHLRNKRTSRKGNGPAILHIHGGGFFSFRAAHSVPGLAQYVSNTDLTIFSVDYRLAPENPFPVPLEDCWSALKWIHLHASGLSIDLKRVAVMGESAGGGLAAAVTLLARDRALTPSLAKQILVYPMLDDRTRTDHTGGLCFFDIDDNITGWTAYLGKDAGAANVSPYAAPGRVQNVEGLPSLYLECPQLDLFLHENVEYVRKFLQANIPTEFHIFEGLPHGFQSMAPTAEITKSIVANRVRAMTTF